MITVQEYVAKLEKRFSQLSKSRKATLRREARKFIYEAPHMADASIFWRGLSARQVLAAD